MMEMNGEGLGVCCQAEFPSDWPHIHKRTLLWSWRSPDPPRQGLLGIILDFREVISKVYFNKAGWLQLPVIYNRCGSKASKIPPPSGGDWVTVVMTIAQHQELLPRRAPVCHFRPTGSTSQPSSTSAGPGRGFMGWNTCHMTGEREASWRTWERRSHNLRLL